MEKTKSVMYSVSGKKYFADDNRQTFDKLPPGAYEPMFDVQTGKFWFQSFSITSDKILELPSDEFNFIVKQMEFFLSPETKTRYTDLGFVYKRSALLYGEPGTGKTVITNRIARHAISNGSIVLFASNPGLLPMAYAFLNDTQPETFVAVLLEEFDSIAKKSENVLLTLLDGQVQKDNVMYLATTNHIDKIPTRLLRAGRINTKLEIKGLSSEARKFYLVNFLGSSFNNLETWVEKSDGLNVDDLKEMIQACYILNEDIDSTIENLRKYKRYNPDADEEVFDKGDYLRQEIAYAMNSVEMMHKQMAARGSLLTYVPENGDSDES